jgi:hypothetical protein
MKRRWPKLDPAVAEWLSAWRAVSIAQRKPKRRA